MAKTVIAAGIMLVLGLMVGNGGVTVGEAVYDRVQQAAPEASE